MHLDSLVSRGTFVSLLFAVSVAGCSGDALSREERVEFAQDALFDGDAGSEGSDGHARPRSSLTPGDVLSVDTQVICTPGYSRGVRNVSRALKAKVAAAYGFSGASSSVEYDHLIPLSLGGSNAETNLWPEPITDARVKDGLENHLRAVVCAGKMDLADVQSRIAADWVKLWNDVGAP